MYRFLIFSVWIFSSLCLSAIADSEKSITENASKILNDQKMRFLCKLNSEEAAETFRFELKHKNITLESFKEAATIGTKLVDGLFLVVKDGKNPDDVYVQMQMSKYKNTEKTWKQYVSRYNTTEKIQNLREIVPTSMEVIIRTGKESFALLLENWLLEQYILISGDITYGQTKSDREKITLFWQKILKDYKFPQEQSDRIIKILSQRAFFNETESKIWKEYFKKKLENWKNSSVQQSFTGKE